MRDLIRVHRYPKGVENVQPGCFQWHPVTGQEAMVQSETQAAPPNISGISSEINISDFNLFVTVSDRIQTCEGRDINHI